MKIKEPEKLAEFVREAVHALGYFRTDAIGWLTETVVANINGSWPRSVMAHGQMMTWPERKELALQNCQGMSWEAWVALSPLGRSMPDRAFDHTCRRISGNYYRYVHLSEWHREGAEFWQRLGFQFSVWTTDDACKAIRPLVGKPGGLAQLPQLPLAQCGQEFCPCDYQSRRSR